MYGKGHRRAGGYDRFSRPNSEKKHPEKQAEGDQGYPGNPVKTELKGKMFGWPFLRSRAVFFTWRHVKLRNVNGI
jgi:hypothetical protein